MTLTEKLAWKRIDEIKEKTENIIKKWKQILHLEEWDIECCLVSDEEMNEYASVKKVNYEDSAVTIKLAIGQPRDKFEKTILFELLSLRISPFSELEKDNPHITHSLSVIANKMIAMSSKSINPEEVENEISKWKHAYELKVTELKEAHDEIGKLKTDVTCLEAANKIKLDNAFGKPEIKKLEKKIKQMEKDAAASEKIRANEVRELKTQIELGKNDKAELKKTLDIYMDKVKNLREENDKLKDSIKSKKKDIASLKRKNTTLNKSHDDLIETAKQSVQGEMALGIEIEKLKTMLSSRTQYINEFREKYNNLCKENAQLKKAIKKNAMNQGGYKNVSEEELEKILAYYSEGHTLAETAKYCSVTEYMARKYIKKAGIMRAYRDKLSEVDKKKIIDLHKSGYSYNKIARHFGVNHGTIRYVIKKNAA